MLGFLLFRFFFSFFFVFFFSSEVAELFPELPVEPFNPFEPFRPCEFEFTPYPPSLPELEPPNILFRSLSESEGEILSEGEL